jgi:type I restriction enzyme R subunit
MNTGINEANINEYGRFDNLKNTVETSKAKAYCEKLEGKTLPAFKVNMKVHNLLQKFIISGGFEI